MIFVSHLLIFVIIFTVLASSTNLIVGYCGRLSFAQASFFAVGCYTYAILGSKFSPDFLVTLGVSWVIAFMLSRILSASISRFSGDSFVLASLVVQAVFYGMLQNWYSPGESVGTLKNLTNGTVGIAGLPRPSIFGFEVRGQVGYLILAGLTLVPITVLAAVATSSPWGRCLRAMRDDNLVLIGLGKNTPKLRHQAFALSAIMAATAGVYYASYIRFVNPDRGSLDESIMFVAMVFIGGLGTRFGPFLGASVMVLSPEIFRVFGVGDANAAGFRAVAFGLLLIAISHLRSSRGMAFDQAETEPDENVAL